MTDTKPLYIKTPLLESHILAKKCGRRVFLKMENMQPSGSFKIRGLSHLVQKKKEEGITQLYSASGGNAGMATAYIGAQMNLPTTVILPETAPDLLVQRLKDDKASVMVHGKNWNETNKLTQKLSDENNGLYVSPFDHPLIWEGHSTMLDEILEQCPEKPSAIALSVGGGGMLGGILLGMKRLGIEIPVISFETFGANCFNAALQAGEPVSIGKISSIAFTLGSLKVSTGVFDLARNASVISKLVTDEQAVSACFNFLEDHRCLVEPSCGATLAGGYSGIIEEMYENGEIDGHGPIVFIVCGGNAVTTSLLHEWMEISKNKTE